MQVFCAWSSLRMSACTVPRTLRSVFSKSSLNSTTPGSRPCSSRKPSTCWSIAAFMNIARIVGAGPLIVMETLVFGATRSKPAKSFRMSSTVQMLTPLSPILP